MTGVGSFKTASQQTIDAATLADLRRRIAGEHPLHQPTLLGLAPCLAQKRAAVEFQPVLRRISPRSTAW